ncbi:MAG: dihydroxyacetone kinase subunit DhaK [Anaerolineae bacterium]
MAMKKFINKPENIVAELLEGYALAYPDKIHLTENHLVVRTVPKDEGKVGVVTLGGSGHEPALSGWVGYGLLDVSVPGEIFAAPGPPRVLEALRLAERGAGVLFIVLNHAGDMMTGNMTMQLAKKEGLNVVKVVTQEDISNAPREDADNRRGLMGCLPVYKVAGAAAEAGLPLKDVAGIAQRMADNMATIAVAAAPATHPVTGQPFFSLPDDEMEVGMGQHGEAGTGRMKMKTADETVDIMLNALLKDLDVKEGDELLVMLNSTGATTLMELFILFRRISQALAEKKIKLVRARVGEFLTVQEQAGFQMFVARMDPELIRLWDAPCDSPFFTVAPADIAKYTAPIEGEMTARR